MMLDIDFAELRAGVLEYAPIGALIGLILAAELIVVVAARLSRLKSPRASQCRYPAPSDRTQPAALAMSSIPITSTSSRSRLVLLVAMIGAHRADPASPSEHQASEIPQQVARPPKRRQVVTVKPGQGI